MKLIEAIIKSDKLDEVTSALENIGIDEFMESAINCHDRQKGQVMTYRGTEYMANAIEKIKLEIIADDDAVGKIIEVIGSIVKTDRREDFRIIILPFIEAS
jgi:nitrogen regulatory protein PII